jgi:hypothetical protein
VGGWPVHPPLARHLKAREIRAYLAEKDHPDSGNVAAKTREDLLASDGIVVAGAEVGSKWPGQVRKRRFQGAF